MTEIMDRRGFLGSLPGLAALPVVLRSTHRSQLPSFGLNHVELSVTDPGRSIEFYQNLFGMPIQARQGEKAILRVGSGPQFIAITRAAAAAGPSISRLGIAVRNFDPGRVVEALGGFGVLHAEGGKPARTAMAAWTVRRGNSQGGGPDGTDELFFGDPHGIVVQVVDPSHCGGSGPLGNVCGDFEPAPGSGSIRLIDLNHFTNDVSDPARANAFYREAFGMRVQAYQAAAAALDVDGGPQFLMFTGGAGAMPEGSGRINHVCFTVEDFEVDPLLGTLADHGIQPRGEGAGNTVRLRSSVSMRMPNRGGAPEGTPELYFSDPDGLRIQLQDSTYCGGGGYLGSAC